MKSNEDRLKDWRKKFQGIQIPCPDGGANTGVLCDHHDDLIEQWITTNLEEVRKEMINTIRHTMEKTGYDTYIVNIPKLEDQLREEKEDSK